MKIDKHQKIAIAVGAIILVVLYFMFGKNAAGDPFTLHIGNLNLPQPSTNLPWWLANNNSPKFGTGFTLPLPTLTQNNSGCDTCSLFS